MVDIIPIVLEDLTNPNIPLSYKWVSCNNNIAWNHGEIDLYMTFYIIDFTPYFLPTIVH